MSCGARRVWRRFGRADCLPPSRLSPLGERGSSEDVLGGYGQDLGFLCAVEQIVDVLTDVADGDAD